MMRLRDTSEALAWLRAHASGALHSDSRLITVGDAFLAWPGHASDGRAHVRAALERGAAACLVEAEGAQAFDLPSTDVALFAGLKQAAGILAAQWWGHANGLPKVLAVTGTNGKTSTSWWLAEAINKLSKSELPALSGCAFVGTLGVGIAPQLQHTGLTTPDALALQRQLAQWADAGIGACAMEASSIGLIEGRLAGTAIAVALFTNFTQDHLDYHGSMQAYWQANRALFDWPGLQAAVVNVDDPQGAQLHGTLATRALDLWSVAIDAPARLRAVDVRQGSQGLAFTLVEGAQQLPMHTHLLGRYNVSNLLGVLAALRALGVSLVQAAQACAQLSPVPGRMQQIGGMDEPLAVIDYAHTPDALTQALAALRPLAQVRGGRLWCVFGCGGQRDALKRPLMGAAAQQGADCVLVTSDNPRGEDPQAIMAQISQGMDARHLRSQVDRALAIAQALREADVHDVVLIAGKGHEDYQEVAGQRRSFSDLEQARQALAARRKAA